MVGQGRDHVNTNERSDQRQLHNATSIFKKNLLGKGQMTKIIPSGQEINTSHLNSLSKICANSKRTKNAGSVQN